MEYTGSLGYRKGVKGSAESMHSRFLKVNLAEASLDAWSGNTMKFFFNNAKSKSSPRHELTKIDKTIKAIINTIIKSSKTNKAIKTIKAKKIQQS